MKKTSKRQGKGQVAQCVNSPQEDKPDRRNREGSQRRTYDLLFLKCNLPNVLFRITGDYDFHRRFYSLLCENSRNAYSVERFNDGCLIRAIKYDNTVKKWHANKNNSVFDPAAKKAGIIMLSDEARETIIAMGLGTKRYHRSGKIHGNLEDLASYGVCYIFNRKTDIKRSWDNAMEVVLLDGKDNESLSNEEFMNAVQQELKSLAKAFKKVLGLKEGKKETPPYYADWMTLVNRMGGKKREPTLMWEVMTHPILWSHVERRSFFEAMWLRRKTEDSIMKTMKSLNGYATWKNAIPKSGPLRKMLNKKKKREDTSYGLCKFIRCTYKHIYDMIKVEVEQDKELIRDVKDAEKKFTLEYEYIDENSNEVAYKDPKFVEMEITHYFPNFLPELHRALIIEKIYV